ncbi:DUF4249 domain-containing protein [Croceivirga thetidis]|uniref:DUF4249 domain-containing protein n=1 Tax=Croceivirga thetidis TaxID=2721623 RepID=A0ABX1GRC2_9FLAO|nr:DUF4249 domain-containing protein [Croceivirga thetidis]NKI32469.1 DUF4249 domain-containing protein [Croceivirga thetidis]
MKKNVSFYIWGFSIFAFIMVSCLEEFRPETTNTEDFLVVEAIITDEFKQHEVLLSRAIGLSLVPSREIGANVTVIDSDGRQFEFSETNDGVYTSNVEFAAEQGKSYTLEVLTNDGREYSSSATPMPEAYEVENFKAERLDNDFGEDGVGIFLDILTEGIEPAYFRFEFEETYKIIAPNWQPVRFRIVQDQPCQEIPFTVDLVPWEDERRTCFGSSKSTALIQGSTADLVSGVVEDFSLHFLSSDNYFIANRYSIEVTQFSQTQDAYSFYQRLGEFSSFDNIFSQVQPGFLEGNIQSISNEEEMVLGYFEVASVSKKRLFFNYSDLFPGELPPPYPTNCGEEALRMPGLTAEFPPRCEDGECRSSCNSPLIDLIKLGAVTYAFGDNGAFFTWPATCGDCTKLGSNVVPEFWEE